MLSVLFLCFYPLALNGADIAFKANKVLFPEPTQPFVYISMITKLV